LFFNYYFQVSDALWKNIHGKMAVPGDVFFTNMPVTVTAKPVLSKHEGEEQVFNVDFIQMDEQSETQETKLRNSTSLIWTDEEVASLLIFLYYSFSLCIFLWMIILCRNRSYKIKPLLCHSSFHLFSIPCYG
jgi:maltodextrin utilization protein YvdJ